MAVEKLFIGCYSVLRQIVISKEGLMQESLWQAVLGEIELSISHGGYVTWFKNTRIVKQKDGVFVIGVGNVFIKNQLEQRYDNLIKSTLKKNGVRLKAVEYKVVPSANLHTKVEDTPVILSQPNQQQSKKTANNALSHSYRQGLNARYTFETFIVGGANELAYAACQAIASNPGTKYNPLFLYGGVGLGKTHLIQAVGNKVIEQNPQARVVYVSTEQFVQEFLDAIRYKKNTDFAGYYRGADVLIIDDIQFIAGKEKTQEEFFHTFNALHQANKQIIISSDKPPKEIPTLEDRLRSRFAWGMSIDMQIPDFETRCAIIQTKAETKGIELPNEVAEYLSQGIKTNIRELEGVLNQLLATCEMRGILPDIEIAKNLLGSIKGRPRHINSKQIVERTARYFHLSTDEILGPKRDKDIVVPRQIAMYLLRSELHLSFPNIAKELGRKDHTTALHSVEKITRILSSDNYIRESINRIKEKLYA